jgi:hypothetical protein
MIVFTGTDLLTSALAVNAAAYVPRAPAPGALAPLPRPPPPPRAVLSSWAAVAAGNMLGAGLAAAGAAAWCFAAGSPPAAFLAALATAKCALPLSAAFGKAVAANFLVNTAVLMAAASMVAASPTWPRHTIASTASHHRKHRGGASPHTTAAERRVARAGQRRDVGHCRPRRSTHPAQLRHQAHIV